jgi:hypothetical protein
MPSSVSPPVTSAMSQAFFASYAHAMGLYNASTSSSLSRRDK